MVFDAAGELMSINDDAYAWLDEVAGGTSRATTGSGECGLPPSVVSTLILWAAGNRGGAGARLRPRAYALERDGPLAGLPRVLPA